MSLLFIITQLMLLILSIILIYILINIINKVRNNSHNYNHNHNHDHSHNNGNKIKCSNEACLDNYNDCPCNENKSKELFTMAQSVFPLHNESLSPFDQILNENMSNINDNYTVNNEENKLTRNHPSQETSTGFFNVLSSKH